MPESQRESPSLRLASLIESNSAQLLSQWRVSVRRMLVARELSVPVLDDHMGDLLRVLAEELRRESRESLIEPGGTLATQENPEVHGLERLGLGFVLEEVVAEYNALRNTAFELAATHQVDVTGAPAHSINRVVDGAIGNAVRSFAEQQAKEIRQRRDEYLAFAVHDLRSPLAAASLATTLLERLVHPPEDSEERTLLTILRSNLQKLDRLIQRVLEEDAAIRAEHDHQIGALWVDLPKLLLKLFEELEPLAKTSRVSLQVEMPENLQGFVDPGRAELIFQNLISNAIRYAPGGEVVVQASRGEQGLQCRVTDNGVGIAPDRLEQIMQLGESDAPAGFGLGLAIVRRLVEAHRGSLVVESQLGHGACFRFDFPDP